MAPRSVDQQTSPPRLSPWHLVLSLVGRAELLLILGAILLGIWAAKRMQHARRHIREPLIPLAVKDHALDEKHLEDLQLLSDLPPPLRSVLWQTHSSTTSTPAKTTSGTLAAEAEAASHHVVLASSSDNTSTPPTVGPWRRHSYPSSSIVSSSDSRSPSPSAEIASDQTTYYPIIDDDGTRRPGLWRRRTLVFEIPPATARDHANRSFPPSNREAIGPLGGTGYSRTEIEID